MKINKNMKIISIFFGKIILQRKINLLDAVPAVLSSKIMAVA